MCNAGAVAHSSCSRTSPRAGNRWNYATTPASTPERMCNTTPVPTDRTTSRHRSGQPLSHLRGPRNDAGCGHNGGTSHCRTREDPRQDPAPTPPADTPPTATRPRPTRAVRHTAEHLVQKITDCAQSDLDSSLSAQNVTLRTKRHPVHKTSPHTTPTHTTRNPGCRPARPRRGRLPPTRPGTPTPTDRTRTTHTSLRNLSPTPQNSYTTRSPTPPTPQTPPPRTSTVLTTNKYRSHEQ